jgi:hypothetical protein
MIKAYGISDATAHAVSEILDELGVAHSIVGGKPTRTFQIIDEVYESDISVYVISGMRNIHKIAPHSKHQIYFVCGAQTALEESNLSDALSPQKRAGSLKESILAELNSPFETDWLLKIHQPRLLDFVQIAVKPMFVNQLQKLVQSITPYAKSKEARSICVSYLCGELSREEMLIHLTGSLKFSAIADLMRSEKAAQLRAAIGEYKLNSKPLDRICEQYGFESFEILYPVNSRSAEEVDDEE